MRSYIQSILEVSVTYSREQRRVAKWLKLFLTIVAVGVLFLTLLLPFTSTDPALSVKLFAANLIVVLACMVLFIMVQLGYADSAATLFVFLVYFGATLPTFFVFQAVSAPTVYGYFVLIPLAGLLKGRRVLVGAVAVTVLTLAVAFWLESMSVLAATYEPSLLDALIMIVLGIALNTSLLLSALDDAEAATADAKTAARELASINQELQISQKNLERARDQLEERVALRTAELSSVNQKLRLEVEEHQRTEEILRQAKNQAEEATKAKSEFLANMSHEIRTPMNGVIGMASLLQRTQLTSEQREYADTIRTSGNALLSLLNGILDISKVESGKISLALEPFALHDCVTSVVDLMYASATDKQLALVCQIAEDVPKSIVGDEYRLRQILVNLVANAIKFTERGTIRISVDTPQRSEPRLTLRFSVSDTGIGIPDDQLGLLFQPFSQVDSSTTRKYEGTGLGLAISSNLAALMGGGIWVESQVGSGSTFIFTIQAEVPRTEPSQFEKSGMALLQGRCALILSMDRHLCQLLTNICSQWSMTVIVDSLDPKDAGQVYREEAIDVALVDWMTCAPGDFESVSGLFRGRRRLPIVILNWHGNAGSKLPIDSDRIIGTLTDPLFSSELRRLLIGHFRSERSNTQEKLHHFDAEPISSARQLGILLVEDNVVNRLVANRILDRLGHNVDWTENGMEAIRRTQEKRYDVIFMDIQMPEMDGLATTQRMRTTLAPENQPYIIAMTAAASHHDREACLNAGMDDYLAKPISVEDVAASLEKFVTEREMS